MNVRSCTRVWAVSVLLAGLLPVAVLRAQVIDLKDVELEEWIDVQVVINVLDGVDPCDIDAALDKANRAFEQARIRLVKKATDPNATADADSSGGLSRQERNRAREQGQNTLNETVGAGKGVKIDIGSNIREESPNTTGLAIHRNPVILVKPHADPNVYGRTIAHELCHVFTLGYDLYDPNDRHRMMYGRRGGGTHLDPNEIERIRRSARKRGRAYWRVPLFLPKDERIPISAGLDWVPQAHGAILDGLHDVWIQDPLQVMGDVIAPEDPTIQWADIREVVVFADDPFDPNGVVRIDIQLGPGSPGDWSVDSCFGVSFLAGPGELIGEVQVCLQDWAVHESVWLPRVPGDGPLPVDTVVHRNHKFVGMGEPPTFHNKSLEITIPTELVALQLVGDQSIRVRAGSQHRDWRRGLSAPPIQLSDQTDFFDFHFEPYPSFDGPDLMFYRSDPTQLDVHLVGVSGWGFTPDGTVELLLDGAQVGRTDVLHDGAFAFSDIPVASRPDQVHSVIAREVDDHVNRGGAIWAPGFFILELPEPDDRSDPDPEQPPLTDCRFSVVFDPLTGEVTVILDCDDVVSSDVDNHGLLVER